LNFTNITPETPSLEIDDVNNVIIGADQTMEYSLNGGGFQDYLGTEVFAGNDEVRVRVKAINGNPASEEVVLNFTKITPETPSLEIDDVNNIIIGADQTMEYSLNGGEFQDYLGTEKFNGNDEVRVRVKATNGNPASEEVVLNFTIENTNIPKSLEISFVDVENNDDSIKIENFLEDYSYYYLKDCNQSSFLQNEVEEKAVFMENNLIKAYNNERICLFQQDNTGKFLAWNDLEAKIVPDFSGEISFKDIPLEELVDKDSFLVKENLLNIKQVFQSVDNLDEQDQSIVFLKEKLPLSKTSKADNFEKEILQEKSLETVVLKENLLFYSDKSFLYLPKETIFLNEKKENIPYLEIENPKNLDTLPNLDESVSNKGVFIDTNSKHIKFYDENLSEKYVKICIEGKGEEIYTSEDGENFIKDLEIKDIVYKNNYTCFKTPHLSYFVLADKKILNKTSTSSGGSIGLPLNVINNEKYKKIETKKSLSQEKDEKKEENKKINKNYKIEKKLTKISNPLNEDNKKDVLTDKKVNSFYQEALKEKIVLGKKEDFYPNSFVFKQDLLIMIKNNLNQDLKTNCEFIFKDLEEGFLCQLAETAVLKNWIKKRDYFNKYKPLTWEDSVVLLLKVYYPQKNWKKENVKHWSDPYFEFLIDKNILTDKIRKTNLISKKDLIKLYLQLIKNVSK
jgi:hypothetical protein